MVKDLNDPTNVDSVPAMLTPGEFVLNKEATQMYGPMIEKMNNHGLMQRHAENQQMYNMGGLVDFLKKHEGWRDEAYDDGYGTWTIGYGRTTNADGSPVRPGQKTTKKDEDSWINKRAEQEWTAINDFGKKHGYDWTDQEKQALASFRYNGGQGMINQLTENGTRDMDTIKSKFGLYNKSGGQHSEGLQNRRNYEMELAGWGKTQPIEGTPATDFLVAPPETQAPVPQPEQAVPAPGQEAPAPQAPATQQQPQREAAAVSIPQDIQGQTGGFAQELFGGLAQSLFGGGAPPAPSAGVGGMQQAKSAEEIRAMTQSPQQPQQFNWGGWVKDLFGGGGEANNVYSGWDQVTPEQALKEAETFNNPGAQTTGWEAPPGMVPPGTQGVTPLPNVPDPNLQNRGAAVANHAGNRFLFGEGDAQERPFVPELDTAPPVPGSDEALLQGSSDTVESVEQMTAKQRWDRLKAERDATPSGPRRVELSNQMNALNVADPAMDPRVGLGSGAAAGARGLAAPTAGGPTTRGRGARAEEAYQEAAQQEEDIWRNNEALQQAQLQAAVTAPDAPGAEFIQSRVNALSDNLTELGVPPGSQGVGADVGVNADPVTGIPAPEGLLPPEEVGAVPGIETTAPGEQSPRLDQKGETPVPEKRAATEQVIANTGETATAEESTAAEKAGTNASPRQVEKAKNVLQENFGDLFDKKELSRAAVLFAGAMLTGASPQKALAIAGQQYLGRLDAKEAQKVKTQQAAAKAAAKNQPVIDMTQSETFFKDGQKVQGFKMTSYGPNGEKITQYVDKNSQPIGADAHQDASIVRGTPEYRERVQDESKSYSKSFQELQDRFGKFEGKDGEDKYVTDFTPGKVGATAAKFGIQNNVSPEVMTGLIDSAYTQARNDAQNGVKPKSIEAYLNQQFITSKTGSSDLFEGAETQKVTTLFNNLEAQSGQSATAITQWGVGKWSQMPQGEKDRYIKRAKNTGVTPFMLFLEDVADGEI